MHIGMIHFVVNPYDPSLDYKGYCQRLFGCNKCLVVKEHKPHEHVHIQGEPCVDDEAVKSILKEMVAKHYRKRECATARPVKRTKTEVTEDGYQYMVKHDTSLVLFKQGFTDDEIESLKDKSDELREELQSKPGEYLFEKIGSGTDGITPRELHRRVSYYASEFYMVNNKCPPPNIKMLKRYWMGKYYGNREDVKWYLSDLDL